MTGFFDEVPSPGSNRHAEQTDCPTCGGHRLRLVEDRDGFEVYARCPECNSGGERQPVEDARWKTYDR